MGYQVIRQPLWIEGKDIQPGVKFLSGPFDLSQISSHVIPETARLTVIHATMLSS